MEIAGKYLFNKLKQYEGAEFQVPSFTSRSKIMYL